MNSREKSLSIAQSISLKKEERDNRNKRFQEKLAQLEKRNSDLKQEVNQSKKHKKK